MTTYYDHRAERTMAEAEADARRAQAEALRSQTSMQQERERRQLLRDDREAQRQERAERRAEKALRRAQRRTATRQTMGTLAAAAKQRTHSVLAAAAMGSPMFIAWGGQLAFATDIMHMGAAAFTLPVAMEGSVLYNAYLTHRAIEKRLPTLRYRLMTWVMAGNAAGMNLWHQVDKLATDADPWAGLQVGAIYAASSLLGIVLWEMKAALDRQTASHRSGAEIRRDLWRRLRYPRMSWSAASIRAAKGCSVEDAWAAAWVDRFGVGPDTSRRDRRLARKVVRYQAKADRAAAKDGRLSIVDGQIVGRPSLDPAPADPEGEKAIEQLRSWDGSAATQRALDRTAAKMLVFGHDFIDDRRAAAPSTVPALPPLKYLPTLDIERAGTGPDPLPALTDNRTDSHASDHAADEEEREETGNRRTATEQVNRAAEEWIRARCRGRNGVGRRPSYREVGDRYDRSETWGGNRVRAVQERMAAQGYEFHDDGTVTAPRKPLTEPVTAVNGSRPHPEPATEVS
jgi:hypothetical protein